jgi:hypothetical protein
VLWQCCHKLQAVLQFIISAAAVLMQRCRKLQQQPDTPYLNPLLAGCAVPYLAFAGCALPYLAFFLQLSSMYDASLGLLTILEQLSTAHIDTVDLNKDTDDSIESTVRNNKLSLPCN